MKKGIYFSLDAMLAIILIISGITMLKVLYISPSLTSQDYLSRDIADIFAEATLSELDLTHASMMISNGTIQNENISAMEQLGELWSSGENEIISKIMDEFKEKYTPNKQFSIFFESDNVYETGAQADADFVSAKRMVSGITANRTRTGFIARAIATKTRKNTTLVAMGDVIISSVRKTSGQQNSNQVEIVYDVDIPQNATILDSYWFIEAAWTGTKFKAYVDDVYIPGSDATGDKLLTGLNSYFSTGENMAKIVYRPGSSGDEGGDDGASHVVVKYEISDINTLPDFTRHYFANVKSNCSIRYKKPVFILGDLSEMHVNMSLEATAATLKINFEGEECSISTKTVASRRAFWSNSDITSRLLVCGMDYHDFNEKYIWVIVDADTYNQRENYGKFRQIVNTSYIYTKQNLSSTVYGYLDVTMPITEVKYSTSLSGSFYRYLSWFYNYTNTSIPLFLNGQFAWLYYTGTDPSQRAKSNNQLLYSHPSQNFIYEFARFGHTGDYVQNTGNNFSISFGSGYGVNPFNSFVYFTSLVPNLVPYGGTFDTEQDALDDAEDRLNSMLGNAIEALEVDTSTLSVSNVPSLWGPLIFQVHSWK